MKKVGRPRNIKSPQELLDLWEEYKQWCINNPMLQHGFYGKDAQSVYREIERPWTLDGFFTYTKNVDDHKAVKQYVINQRNAFPEFVTISDYIKDESRQQMAALGLGGVYNANLTARMTGYADRQEINQNIVAQIADVFPEIDELKEKHGETDE